MSIERPFEMEFLPRLLRLDFSIHLPGATTGTQEERERNFLSRALAAYAVHKLSGCTFQEAAQATVFSPPVLEKLWVLQVASSTSDRVRP